VTYGPHKLAVPEGTVLRSALLRNGLTPHNGAATTINCRGLGTCGTCAVAVRGAVDPALRNGVERRRLGLPPFDASRHAELRLACQCAIAGDVEVEKRDGFWGGGTDIAPPAPKTSGPPPLGGLEYLLDSRSPPSCCGTCAGTTRVGCPNCDGAGSYVAMGDRTVQCRACRGSGLVVCRDCFDGDPWDLEAVRARAERSPD